MLTHDWNFHFQFLNFQTDMKSNQTVRLGFEKGWKYLISVGSSRWVEGAWSTDVDCYINAFQGQTNKGVKNIWFRWNCYSKRLSKYVLDKKILFVCQPELIKRYTLFLKLFSLLHWNWIFDLMINESMSPDYWMILSRQTLKHIIYL